MCYKFEQFLKPSRERSLLSASATGYIVFCLIYKVNHYQLCGCGSDSELEHSHLAKLKLLVRGCCITDTLIAKMSMKIIFSAGKYFTSDEKSMYHVMME